MPDWVRRPLFPLRNKVSRDGCQPGRKTRRYFEVFANDRTGGIRINLVGRESNGVVQPGAEFDNICAQLVADLGEVRNVETGEPLATEIIITQEHYSGESLDYLPDILITWNRYLPAQPGPMSLRVYQAPGPSLSWWMRGIAMRDNTPIPIA